MIDRISPTIRPDARPVQFQKWNKLLFLHWQVPLEQLRKLVPTELSIDLFDGAAYVGIVPFVMNDVRPRWWPKALAFNFLETNVRTYVHFEGRPGVFFLSLDASSRLAVWAARNIWHLPYHFADMSFQQHDLEINYQSKRRAKKTPRLQTRYRIGEQLGASPPDTLDFFLLERYLMFLGQPSGLQVGAVHHTPYIAHRVDVVDLHDGLVEAAGLTLPEQTPFCTHYVESVDAEIFPLRRV
jgi:uncharacterized protein YqjF (DUF2071 family)